MRPPTNRAQENINMITPKTHVIAAFRSAKINLDGAVWITTCAASISGRYVAYYGAHGGWQIGTSRSPSARTTVTLTQAVAWANEGVWADGTSCLNGYKVVDGVEKGRIATQYQRIAFQLSPVEAAKEVPVAALVAPVVDAAKAEKTKAALELARAGFTPEQIIRLLS